MCSLFFNLCLDGLDAFHQTVVCELSPTRWATSWEGYGHLPSSKVINIAGWKIPIMAGKYSQNG